MRKWLLHVLLSCAAGTAHAEEFTAKVIIVLDGDTVLVLRDCKRGEPEAPGPHLRPPCRDNKPVKIRLAEIDAPEKAQAGGMESKQSLSGMVLKKQVSVNVQAVDNYGRLVGHLEVNGRSVNEEQVRRGMAWEYSNYHSNKTYIALQDEAQLAQRGLWAQVSPMPPWQWRKLHAADAPAPVPAHLSTAPAPVTGDYTCGAKRHCSQMLSCDEARFYLTHCGVKSLDRNGDGVPCEKLCGYREKK